MEVAETFGDQVNIIGVPGLADPADFGEFLTSTGTDELDHLSDPDAEIWDRFGVTEQRTYVFINDDGTWERGGYGRLAQDVEDLIAS